MPAIFQGAPDPYLGTDEYFDPVYHWGPFPGLTIPYYRTGESVAGHDPSGEDFFSKSNGEASLKGIIDAKRIRGCQRWFLGYDNMTTASSYTLQRMNPAVHPLYTNMVATGIASRRFAPIRKDLPLGSTNRGLKLPCNTLNTAVVAVTNTGGDTRSVPYYAGYEKAEITVRFSPAPYRFLNDSETQYEYQRNTLMDTDPRVEVLTLSGFQLVYAEGGTNTLPTTNAKGKVAPGDYGQVLIKPDLKITTYQIPEKFLSTGTTPGQFFPTKVIASLGTLNRYAWNGYKKGTLLFNGVHFTRKPWALAAGRLNLGPPHDIQESIFNYDMECLFSLFDPAKGYDTNALIVNADTYGHNCFPYRGEPTGAALASDDINAGKWFFATYSGLLSSVGTDSGSQGIYRYSNYNNIWNSAWNTDLT